MVIVIVHFFFLREGGRKMNGKVSEEVQEKKERGKAQRPEKMLE